MKRTLISVAFAVLAALTVAGCGSDTDSKDSTDNSSAQFNDADVTFAQSMIPHHEQAVEMAAMAQERASSVEVKQLAEKIEAAQGPEIDTMTGWLEDWGQEVSSDSEGGMDHSGSDMSGMMSVTDMESLSAATGAEFDQMFLTMMIEHHTGAIEMAKTEQQDGENPDAIALAEKIEADQAAEIAQMDDLSGPDLGPGVHSGVARRSRAGHPGSARTVARRPPQWTAASAVPNSTEGTNVTLTHARNRSGLRRMSAAPVISALLLGLLLGCGSDPANDDTSGQAEEPGGSVDPDQTSMPPWPAPTDVPARVASAGLDLGPMGTAEHYHPKLRIIISGKDVPIPANIGVDPTTGAMSAVHTHETDGTIHIEADTAGETFTLGQLFTQWGVTLTPTQIGGVTAKDGQQMDVTSNGMPVAGDPKDLRLEPDQVIVLRMP